MTTTTKNGREPAARNFVDASALFSTSHRRSKAVNITPDQPESVYVIVRAMSAGERRLFLARSNVPAPTPEDPNATALNRDWFMNGDRNRVTLALCCVASDGLSYMFPEAAKAARALLYGNDALREDLAEIDDLDPVAEQLLVQEALDVSLVTQDSVDRLEELVHPLAKKTESSTTLQQPSTSQTPT